MLEVLCTVVIYTEQMAASKEMCPENLQKFFSEICKKDDSEYKPDWLTVMLASLE